MVIACVGADDPPLIELLDPIPVDGIVLEEREVREEIQIVPLGIDQRLCRLRFGGAPGCF